MDEDPDITSELGRRVALLRQESGMSQQALADAAGLTVQAISRIERATREPRINTLVRVASGLGITLPQLLDLGDAQVSRPLRADVEELARFLDDKPVLKVKVIARFAKMFVDDEWM